MHQTEVIQQVRYAETDRMGVVYYANYLVWFEVGRNHHFRARGIPYTEVESRGFFLPVSEVRCRILLPAAYDDEVVIRTKLREMKSRTLTLEYRILRGDDLLAEGETVHVCLGPDRKVARIPEWIRAGLGG